MSFKPTEQVRRHADDEVGWLSTVTPSGKPVPRPVWFVFDGESYLLFTEPDAAKVRHVRANPNVTLHYNSGHDGSDVLVVVGTAVVEEGPLPSTTPEYVRKYESELPKLGMDWAKVDAEYGTAIRVTPTRSWGW